MFKGIIIVLREATAVAWAWLSRRQRRRYSARTTKPPILLPAADAEKPSQPSDEAVTPLIPKPIIGKTIPDGSPDGLNDQALTVPNAGRTAAGQQVVTTPIRLEPVTRTFTEQLARYRVQAPTGTGTSKVVNTEHAKRIAPANRGGGRMELEASWNTAGQRKPARRGPQLRLVCFKGTDRMWRLAAELPDDDSVGNDVEILQDGQPLTPFSFNDNRWALKYQTGMIEAAERRQDGRRWQLEIDCTKCLIFKLLEESETEEGRLVSVMTRGAYLVIVSEEWSMSESAGIHLCKERNVGIAGHLGYRFNVCDGTQPRLEFRRHDGQRVPLQFRTACFMLMGELATSAFGEFQSPVFLRSPPKVHAPDAESWNPVQTLVLGVAGKGRNKWKKAIRPNPINNEVDLSEHFNGKKGGWYYLRLYDVNEILLDSLYFTFATSLRGVVLSGASVLPAVGSHLDARLEVEHDDGSTVDVVGEQKLERLPFAGGTAFRVPVRCEQVDWQIGWPDEPLIKCTTLIEIIWWALGRKNATPTDADWIDKPIAVTSSDFNAASDRELFIRLPRASSWKQVLVGFPHDEARCYYTKAEERIICIRLGDFAASNQAQTVGVTTLRIWVEQNGLEFHADVLSLEVAYQCCICGKRFKANADALTHAIEHKQEYFQELSYDDLCNLNPDLPSAIYQCSYRGCGFYARGDDTYATSVIDNHIQSEHSSPQHPATILFRCVTDLDEIRQNIEQSLPHIFRCNKCGQQFEHFQSTDFADHIFGKHRSQLFKLV